jgi:hypothetical protein
MKNKIERKRNPAVAVKRVVIRTGEEIFEALENLPGRVDIYYSRNKPRLSVKKVGTLKEQLCRFLDGEESAANESSSPTAR